jgi:hypothetical protein
MTSSPINSVAFQVPENITFTKDFDQFIVQLTEIYTKLARASNAKDVGTYDLTELVNGQKFFTIGNPQIKRSAYRKVFAFGAIAPGATLNIAHGITGITTFTRMYGTIITNVVDDRPLPYVDTIIVTNQVSLLRNGANIVIINGATAPNITSGIVILEYLKS